MDPPDLTGLLIDWSRGDRAALDRMIPLVHHELHRLAHRCMLGERTGHPLQTTALINEAYVRLVDIRRVDWRDRSHFFAVCGRVMRRILVDFARTRESLKRGGGLGMIPVVEGIPHHAADPDHLIAIDQALERLARVDPRKAQVIELRFFGGLSVEETAEALHVSADTVMRDWRLARVWLLRSLKMEEERGA